MTDAETLAALLAELQQQGPPAYTREGSTRLRLLQVLIALEARLAAAEDAIGEL